jgi:hypothetical protein
MNNMRKEIVKESVIVGLTTLGIGSAMMLIPIRQKWWPFVGTFFVGFLAHMGFEYAGMNEKFCRQILGDE